MVGRRFFVVCFEDVGLGVGLGVGVGVGVGIGVGVGVGIGVGVGVGVGLTPGRREACSGEGLDRILISTYSFSM